MYIWYEYECILYCVMSRWGDVRHIHTVWWGAVDLNSRNRYFIMKRVKWTAMYTVYSCMHFLYMCIMYHPRFDRVKGHVRDPSSNSMSLLTSSVYVPSFIILRPRVHELSWERRDGHTRRSHKVFWGTPYNVWTWTCFSWSTLLIYVRMPCVHVFACMQLCPILCTLKSFSL